MGKNFPILFRKKKRKSQFTPIFQFQPNRWSIDRLSFPSFFFSLVLEKLGLATKWQVEENRFQNSSLPLLPFPTSVQREPFIPLSTCDERGGQCTGNLFLVTGTAEPIFLSFISREWSTLNRNGRYVYYSFNRTFIKHTVTYYVTFCDKFSFHNNNKNNLVLIRHISATDFQYINKIVKQRYESTYICIYIVAKEGRGRSNFDNCIRLPCSYPFLRFLFRYKESGFERRGEFTMQPETGFDPLKWLAPCQHRNTSATNVSLSLPFVSLTAIPELSPWGGLLILIVASPDSLLPP